MADAEVEAPICWPHDSKSRLIVKDPDAGKDWGLDEKRVAEDEMVGQHQLKGHKSEQTLEDSEGQRSLECCSAWGHKESDTTEWLNSHNNNKPESPVRNSWETNLLGNAQTSPWISLLALWEPVALILAWRRHKLEHGSRHPQTGFRSVRHSPPRSQNCCLDMGAPSSICLVFP